MLFLIFINLTGDTYRIGVETIQKTITTKNGRPTFFYISNFFFHSKDKIISYKRNIKFQNIITDEYVGYS